MSSCLPRGRRDRYGPSPSPHRRLRGVRLVESQTALLTDGQAGSLGRRLIARAQQQ